MARRIVGLACLGVVLLTAVALAQPKEDSLAARGGKRQKVAAFLPMRYAGKNVQDDVLARLDDRLWKAAFETKAFKLVERARLDDVLEEQFLDRSIPMDARQAARAGKALKAELIGLVTLELPTDDDKREVHARISCRMVNVGTTKIEMYGVGDGTVRRSKEYPSWDDMRIGAGYKAIEVMAGDMFAARGKIIELDDGAMAIKVNIGTMAGVKEGTVLSIFRKSDFDPATGVTPGRFAGVMIVATEQVGPSSSVCRIYLTPDEERRLKNKPEERRRLIERRFDRLRQGDEVKVGQRAVGPEAEE